VNAPDHDVDGARFANGVPKPPFDPHSLAKTVTCGGGEGNYHPSGLRRYTNREFACLQTFPIDFQFYCNVKKQIGNAVPPKLAQAIYQAIVKSLQETDERELRDEQDRRQNPVVID
jgi:DNA (cytosine-5)-methyltransferase 1